MITQPKWETRVSSRGIPYQVQQVQQAMPWIEPEYLECAVYLYPSEKEAEDGDRIGGSGFITGIDVGSPQIKFLMRPRILCVVTNKHVIDAGNMVIRINTLDGKCDILALDASRWYHNGDDIAVCPVRLSLVHKPAIYYVPSERFLTKKIIEDFDIGPGDDVFIVGRFINHEGKQRNLPSARFGNIAQMPWEPIVVDGYPQESFLVEARSISGYSGSPVFVFCHPPQLRGQVAPEALKMVREGTLRFPGISSKRLAVPFQLGPWLLGINYCYIRLDEPIWSKLTDKPVNDDWFIKSNTGMMGVVPAWKLAAILDGDEIKPIIEEGKLMAAEAISKNSSVELNVRLHQ